MSKHETFKAEKCGTFLGKIKSYIVASPNGIVTYKCHGKGLIEIKFSYSIRDKTSQNLLQNVTLTFSKTTAESLYLENHKCYAQVISQMLITRNAFAFLLCRQRKKLWKNNI